ncbi:MAG: hypothetical protein QOD77_1631 [Thermoplasmata archaeon]|nr:hypothetical protein [Thermoplasmata archaeon]
MSRIAWAALALLLAPALSGCSSAESGTWFGLHVADGPGAIDQFRRLTVEVSKVTLYREGGGTVEVVPQAQSFDLAKLQDGNVSSVFSGRVDPGQYKRIELTVVKATGVLQADDRLVSLQVPGGKLVLDLDLDIATREINYLFDIQVDQEGGAYVLKASPEGSKVISKPTNGRSRDA